MPDHALACSAVSPLAGGWQLRPAPIAIVIVLTVGVGAFVGVQIGHKRAADRDRAAAERARASARAEARAEKRELRQEKSSEALDNDVEAANRELIRAARAGQRGAVARAEARLTQASRRSDAAQESNQRPPKQPYARELDRFPVKRAPLFVQQITSSDEDHVLFVAVARPWFCLKSASDRIRRVHATYAPIDRRLRTAGIEDFRMVVTPITLQAPSRSNALAIASAGRVTLSTRGRAC